MRQNHNRTMKISKTALISKIEENKQAHIIDYNEAVEAYHKKAADQIKKASKDLKEGSLKISISLVAPVNRVDEYDKIIEMFKWEMDEEIELTQSEFNEYVHDDNDSSIQARFLNSSYKG